MMRIFFCLFIVLLGEVQAQIAKIDSLLLVAQKMPEDTNKVLKLNEVATMTMGINPKQGYEIAVEALKLAEKLDYIKGKGLSYKTLGNTQYMQGALKEAITYYEQGLQEYASINNIDGIASCENNIGLVYNDMGDYEKAMKFHLKTLKLREEIKDDKGIAKSLLNIGNVYLNQENLDEALKYYQKSAQICEKINLLVDLANNYNNMGNIYKRQKKTTKAIEVFSKAAEIFEKIGNPRGVLITDLNLGDVYLDAQDYTQALASYNKALPIAEKINDKILLGLLYASKGNALARLQNFGEAYDNLKKGLSLLQETGARNEISKVYDGLVQYYELQGNYKEALYYHKQFKGLKDSLFTENQAKAIAKMREIYESDKKEAENELLRKENALKDSENERKNIFLLASVAVLALVGTLAVILYKNNREKQRTNQLLKQQAEELAAANDDISRKNVILEQQKEEIAAQRDAIEEKNKQLIFKNEQIQASIRAARLIQNTILPYRSRIQLFLKDAFVFYQPKDVVSGDFYWIDKEDKYKIIAAIDCTGHGVSGAMMTMLAYSILDRIVHVYHITNPADILEKMHQEVKHALAQDETGNRDGMDIALISIDENQHVTFAGAKRPLVVFNSLTKEILEIKGQRRSIGGDQNENIHFENHILQIPPNSMIYLFSDGYADQNDLNRKKFSEEKLRKLFEKIAPMPCSQQEKIIAEIINKYMEGTEQRDDMMIIGIRI
ncbi:MAG: tetratricopeptide repeat protein [Raineya sp.]|nr:tetratricopeptide repeat protein [Raineya sp.]MDW8295751.1 tetratricopeptide repeat protein [Raineya sp.]